MRLGRLVRSSTFRYALVYMALFSVSVLGVLAFVYFTTANVITRQIDETIQAELAGLTEHYEKNGIRGVKQVIDERVAEGRARHALYLLADADFARISGNLLHWPEAGRRGSGWVDFLIHSAGADESRPQIARARTFMLPGNFHLLVGRDMTELDQFQRVMTEALLGALALSVVLAAAGGVLMSRDLLRRLDAINRGSRAIIRGDLKRRMPVTGSGDEFDQLSGNLNAMLDQIHELMAGMRQVADNIAHDLRSPISRLRSRLEVTLMEKPDPKAYRSALRETIDEADAILKTFNALLDIALAESGALREQFEPVDLDGVAADVADLYQPLAEEKGLAFRTSLGRDAVVMGNRHLISQVLANLLDNAVKYTPKGGAIGLNVARTPDGVEVVVSDTGPGIPEEARGRVLRRFVRLDRSRKAPGSGLGLSLVAAVAGSHNAELRLGDNQPGLKVSLLFPADQRP